MDPWRKDGVPVLNELVMFRKKHEDCKIANWLALEREVGGLGD